jgi:uncharacterized protein
MRKYFLSLLLILIAFISKSQSDTKIILGNIDSIDSKILEEKRKIWVYVPNSAQSGGLFAQVKYPVVYLLDGDAHFLSVVGMIQQLSSVNGNTICPEMIVVGIPNTDRTRDLTPTHVDTDPMGDSNAVRTSGGGERFAAFFEKELIPYIEAAYPTLPYRMLIGHSFGGLTVMNILVNHKELFNAYVAIDPSMFWDNRKLLRKASPALEQQDYKGKALFLGIANTMRPNMDTIKVKRDTSFETDHIRSILAMNNILKKNKRNGLAYDYKYYNGDTHGSVPLIATYDALHSIFRFYDFRLMMEDYMNFSRSTINKVEEHYKEVSRQFGFAFAVPETMVNQLGYVAMSQKKMEEAEYLFKSNVKNYPTSQNVYDSIGDFYVAKGEKEKAIESYKKALGIKEWADTRNKLNALLK